MRKARLVLICAARHMKNRNVQRLEYAWLMNPTAVLSCAAVWLKISIGHLPTGMSILW